MPTNDEYMTYDYTTHRYVLTIDGANTIGNASQVYGNENTLIFTLQSISRTIYNFIYTHGSRVNKYLVEYWLANEEELRPVIYEAMLSQLEADMSSGMNDVKNQAGVNFETGQVINRKDQQARQVCLQAEEILTNAHPNILYSGSYKALYYPLWLELQNPNRYIGGDY